MATGSSMERYWSPVTERAGLWISLAAAWGILAFCAAPGLTMGFTHDDMMNLHAAWIEPWPKLLVSCLTWWSDSYRPVGALWYRAMFAASGFNPFPFHVASLLLIALNIGLTAWLTLELTGSRPAAGLAAIGGAFNAGLADLYVSTATIYDILCFSGYAAALGCYVRFRRDGRRPRWPEMAAVLGLMILALDAKEMAATLPLAIGLYEVLFHGRRADPRTALLGLAAIVPYAAGKLSASSKLAGNPDYALQPSLAAYAKAMEHYINQLANVPYGSIAFWMIALAMAVALVAGNRAIRFGTGVAAMGVLPIAFISLRSGFAFYVPFLGILIALSAGLAAIRFPWWVLAVLVLWQQRIPLKEYENQVIIREMAAQWPAMFPQLGKDASILVLNDPFLPDEWTPLFVARLLYRQPELTLNRLRLGAANKPEDYTHVVDYVDGRYVPRKAPLRPNY